MSVERHSAAAFSTASDRRVNWCLHHPVVGEEERAAVRQAFLPLAGRVLDLGCGEGTTLHHLGAPPGAVGVDLFLPPLKLARDLHVQTHLVVADAYHLPFADRSFDHVLVHNVLHHLDRPALVLAEAHRVLRPSGRLDVLEPCGRNPLILMQTLSVPAERGARRSTAAALTALLADRFLVVDTQQLQALPLHRLLFHWKHGAPQAVHLPLLAGAVAAVERLAEVVVPRDRWALIHLRATPRAR